MFEKSITDMATGGYLGDSIVVDRLVGQFINDLVHARKIEMVYRLVNGIADIFQGFDEHYKVVEGWNDGRDLKSLRHLLVRRLGLDDGMATIEVFQAAFAEIGAWILDLKKDSVGKSDEAIQAEVAALKKYIVAILLGAVDTMYPNGKSWK